MRGRRPKPTHLKLVAGNPGKRPLNQHEPQPVRVRPPPPPHLNDGAQAAWRTFAAIIDKMGILTEADLPALEDLSETYAELRQARADLAAAGAITIETVNRSGGAMLRVRPEVKVIADAARRFAMWCARFGLTPADRTRVSAKLDDDRSHFAEFGT